MGAEQDAERQLERARKKAVREELFLRLPNLIYEAEHVERRRGDENWTCRLSARTAKGRVVRSLFLTVKTPSPLLFDRTYSWDLFAFCPLWVKFYGGAGPMTFVENVKSNFGIDP